MRLSKNPASALTSASRLLSKPACPAGLRNRIVSPAMQRSSWLFAEDHPEQESDAEGGKDRLGWILAHVLLAVFLQGAGATGRIAPSLLCLPPIFLRHVGRCRAKIFRR